MNALNTAQSIGLIWPEWIVAVTAFTVITLDLFVRDKNKLGLLALAGLTLALLMLRLPEKPLLLFHGFFTLDQFSIFFKVIALLAVMSGIALTLAYKSLPQARAGELYALFCFLCLGLMLMGSSSNLLMIFVAIEFVSLTSYIVTGFQKETGVSNEASIKYLLFGSAASACMLYGISLIFGLTGSLDLHAVNQAALANPANSPMFMIGFILMLAGLAFKISAAPFHMWAPDVYTGAPTPVTAFLTVAPKSLGFAVLLRVLLVAFPFFRVEWSMLLAMLAALTMTLGNVIAISQTNVKRLLAYSSIAQAGYILMGVVAANSIGLSGVLYYAAAYTFTNLGAFAVVLVATQQAGHENLSSFAGLSKKAPFLAVAMTLFLISLAGLPPLAGYIGKFMVIAGVIQQGQLSLAIIAAINSAVAVYYYFKIIREMYLVPVPDSAAPARSLPVYAVVIICVIAVLILGIFPAPLMTFLSTAANI